MKKRVAVLGGDDRQIHLAQLLHDDGAEVVTWGLEKGNAPFCVPLDRALESEIIILPLPVCRGDKLNLPLTDMKLKPGDLLDRFHRGQIIFGGMIQSLEHAQPDESFADLLDYYDREEVQIANAVPTAEGAIMRAMEETDFSIQGSCCLIAGYGRIGKILAHRLHGLGARVTVAARRLSDLAWIEAYGYHPIHIKKLSGNLGEFDLIFNTAPAMVFDAECLCGIKKGCVLLELASLPGGFDMNAVKQYGLRMLEERGLPGKMAPISAARAIREGIYHILEERGVL